jgi:hypothetical protein
MSAPQFRVKRGSASKYQGQQVREIAVATFDPSANTGQRTVAAHNLGVYLPNKAVIINAFYDVVTTFTSAADTATIKLGLVTQDDAAFVAAIAINDSTNPWDSGLHGTLTAGTTTLTEAAPNTRTQVVHAKDIAAGYIKTTAERELVATVAVQALTAGKLNLYVEYVISD